MPLSTTKLVSFNLAIGGDIYPIKLNMSIPPMNEEDSNENRNHYIWEYIMEKIEISDIIELDDNIKSDEFDNQMDKNIQKIAEYTFSKIKEKFPNNTGIYFYERRNSVFNLTTSDVQIKGEDYNNVIVSVPFGYVELIKQYFI